MKKKLCTVLLALMLILSLVTPVFATESAVTTVDTSALDEQISILENAIDKIQNQSKVLGENVNVIMGNVISTEPYIIEGGGVGDQCTEAIFNGVKYFVINNPQDGQLTAGYFYTGTHKFAGITTIVINRKWYIAYVFDKFKEINEWRSLGEQIAAKKKELDKLITQRDQILYKAKCPVVEETNLPSFADTIDQNLTVNGDMYIFNDKVMNGKYEYPQSWGKPIDKSKKDYHKVVFTNGISHVIFGYNAVPNKEYVESVMYGLGDMYENIQVLSKNSGIEIIYMTRTITGGQLSILGTNGAAIDIIWETPDYFCEGQYNPDLQSEKDIIEAQVLQMVQTIQLTQAAG